MNPIFLIPLFAAQQAAPQAELHSARSVFFIEMPDVPAALAAYEKAPTVQLVRDPKVRATVYGLTKEFGIDLDDIFTKAGLAIGLPPDQAASPVSSVIDRLREVSSFSLSVQFQPSAEFATLGKMGQALEALGRIQERVDDWSEEHDGKSPSSIAELKLPAELQNDPWGHPYVLQAPKGTEHATAMSLGADGAPGGTSSAMDLSLADAATLGSQMGGMMVKQIGVLAVCDFQNDQAAQRAHGLLVELAQKGGLTGAAPAPQQIGSQKYEVEHWTFAEMPEMPLWSAASGKRLLIGGGMATPSAAADIAAHPDRTLSVLPEYRALSTKLGPASGATLFRFYMQTRDILEVLAQSGKETDAMAELLQRSGASSFGRMQLVGDRFLTESVSVANEKDYFGKSMGRTPLPPEIRKCIPQDAVAFYSTSLDGPALYQELLTALRAEVGAEMIDARIRELEEKNGVNLEHDIFGSLGGGLAGYMLPVQGVPPGMALVLDLKDQARFTKGVQVLMELLEGAAGDEFQVKYKPFKYKSTQQELDIPMWTITFGGEDAGNGPMAGGFMTPTPALAIAGNRALITLVAARAKKEVRRLLGEESAEHPLFSQPDRPPADATFVGYMDWGAVVGGVYKFAKTFGGAMLGGSSGFDVNKLPEAETFTHFYRPTVIWSKTLEAGTCYTRYESSFGPETWIGMVALVGGVAVSARSEHEGESHVTVVETTTAAVPPEPPKPPKVVRVGSREAAQSVERMARLATALAIYQSEKGGYPAKLDELLAATPNFPNGLLKDKAVPVDGWGRAFGYAPKVGGYTLWSFGPDGVDQKGAGDDVKAP